MQDKGKKQNLLTVAQYAEYRGCSDRAVRKAISEGRVSVITKNGKRFIDQAKADMEWAATTNSTVAIEFISQGLFPSENPEPEPSQQPQKLELKAEKESKEESKPEPKAEPVNAKAKELLSRKFDTQRKKQQLVDARLKESLVNIELKNQDLILKKLDTETKTLNNQTLKKALIPVELAKEIISDEFGRAITEFTRLPEKIASVLCVKYPNLPPDEIKDICQKEVRKIQADLSDWGGIE